MVLQAFDYFYQSNATQQYTAVQNQTLLHFQITPTYLAQ